MGICESIHGAGFERNFALRPEEVSTLDLPSKSPGARSRWRGVQVKVEAFGSGLDLAYSGMLLVSPVVALVTLIIFAGWILFTSERGNISWRTVLLLGIIFVAGLFFLSFFA